MIDDQELTRRLTAAMRTDAATVRVDDEPFDPTRVPLTGAAAGVPRPLRRPTRRRLAAAAAAAVLALGVGAVVARDGGDDAVGLQTRAGSGTPLLPGWAPPGMVLDDLEWGPGTAEAPVGTAEGLGDRAQLFGDPDHPDARLLVEVGGDIAMPGGVATQVRGADAEYLDSWPTGASREMPDDGLEPGVLVPLEGFSPEDEGDASELTWEEGGTIVRALFRGLPVDEAKAFLDGLELRVGDDPNGGFDPAEGASLVPLSEALAVIDPPATTLTAIYRTDGLVNARAMGEELYVTTGAAAGGTTPAYLSVWFAGDLVEGDVAVRWRDDGDSGGDFTAVRPDGSWTAVGVATPGDGVDHEPTPVEQAIAEEGSARPLVDRIAAGLRPASEEELTGMRAEALARITDLPLVATLEFGSGTVELHGEGGRPDFACVQVGDELGCAENAGVPGPNDLDLTDPATKGWFPFVRVDDERYQVVVSSTGTPGAYGWDEEASALAEPVDLETAADGEWEGLLAGPDSNVGQMHPDVEDGITVCLALLELMGFTEEADELRAQGLTGQEGLEACAPVYLTSQQEYFEGR